MATKSKRDPMPVAVDGVFKADQIRQLRERAGITTSVFAHILNAHPSTVTRWESGSQRPNNYSRKLLAIVEKHGIEILCQPSRQPRLE